MIPPDSSCCDLRHATLMINDIAPQTALAMKAGMQALLKHLDAASTGRMRQLSGRTGQNRLDPATATAELLTILNAATFVPGLPLQLFGRANTQAQVGAVHGGLFGTAEAARDAAATHFGTAPGADAELRARVYLRLDVRGAPYFDAQLPEEPGSRLVPGFGI